MERFLKGFAWNFAVLLAAFSGFRLWNSGQPIIGMLCLAAAIGLIIHRIMRVRNQRDESDSQA